MIALLSLTTAHADWYDVEFCVQMDVTGFGDYTVGDYWNGSGGVTYQPIRGVRLGITEFHPAPDNSYRRDVFQGFASDVDGCVTVALSDNYRYEVAALSDALVNGVPIHVHEGSTTSAPQVLWVKYGPTNRFQPTAATTKYIRPTPEDALRELAVATYIFSVSNFGLGSGLPIFLDSESCCNGSDQTFIKAASDFKYKVAHEIIHGLVRRRDSNEPPQVDYDRAENGCIADPWDEGVQGRWQKDWASAALKEGFADFGADWLWNVSSPTETDCEHPQFQDVDIDVDGSENAQNGPLDKDVVIDPPDTLFVNTSCEGPPLSSGLRSYVSSRDWLADCVNAADDFNNGPDCQGTMEGVGSSFDAERYFWDMLNDEDVPITTLVTMYDAMDPRNWEKQKDSISLARNPFRRLTAAAASVSETAAHNAQKDNGVDHGP